MSHVSFIIFVLKYLSNLPLHVPSICSNRVCFKVQMTGCSVGLRQSVNGILRPDKDLNYFDKLMPLLTQYRIFENSSMT